MNSTREKRETLKNPEETTGFIGALFFGWTLPIFRKGSKRDLEIKDLYDPLESDESERLGDRLEMEWKKELKRAELKKRSAPEKDCLPNLMWPIIRTFWVSYMLPGLSYLLRLAVLRISQAVLQGWVIGHFDKGAKVTTTRSELILHICLLILVNLGIAFTSHHGILRSQQIGMRVRVACCSMIYRKVLRLDQAVAVSATAGQVTNLISNDVARFDLASIYLHYIWVMPIQVFLVALLMWESAGVLAAIVGVGAILMQTIPFPGCLSSLIIKLRSKIAVETDERVQLMSELISGMRILKMYSWEKPFELMVSRVRGLEMKLISYVTYLAGVSISIGILCERVSLYLTLAVFVLMGNSPSAKTVFLLTCLLNVLKFTCGVAFPNALMMASEVTVSIRRLTAFLLLDEVKSTEKIVSITQNGLQDVRKKSIDQQIEHGVGIEIIEVAANWIHGQLPPTLCEVSIEVKSLSLCVIVGSVGSGKSSLLHLVLGELPVGAGRLSFFTGENGQTRITSRDIRISYSSQDPWLFSASIRDNILFGQPYDERRYQEVTRVCALLKDFEQLAQGDLSFVGERGASLSGGQRARVNLARAVYRDADLYLLDDPLSAVDPRVGRHLFEECITGFLKDKTRILVTHELQYLREADKVVVFNRGTVEVQGTYEELHKSNFRILDSEKGTELDEEESTDVDNVENVKSKKTAARANGIDQSSKVTENSEGFTDIIGEEKATGKMSSKVYWGYFLAGGNFCSLTVVAAGFVAGQIAFSGTDYWLSYWTNQETIRATFQLKESATDNIGYGNDTKNDYQMAESEWFDEYGLLRPVQAIYIYSACILGCILLIIPYSMLFMRICMNASRKIHNRVFAQTLQTSMRFFDTNPSGRILNRFSKDMGSMDELLPKLMLLAFQLMSIMIGVFVMVAVANNWMILPGIVVGGTFYLITTYYLKTAQDLKRLEGITKSPMLSHVVSTLNGLTTIRCRGPFAEGLLLREFDRHQDAHTGAWYLTIATSNTLGLFLDLISWCFISCVCLSFSFMDEEDALPGFVGLAISQSLILSGLMQYGIRQSTEIIAQMTSVERILQYADLTKEEPFTTDKPPPSTWPSKGGLVFKGVTMRYADNKPPVLKDLNLSINPGWKIGIVGRTGAGKSSLISALFRLTGDGLEGEIVLDGIDTKSIGLHELRPRISIIPQEPILFSTSLRYNLDPFDQYSDAELWESLREVELGDAVPSLDFLVAGGGANFSVGQRQLICLARAILRNNRVLVLDEATANVDRRTDALIQNTIRRRFADCTVLTIAHRLETIMDSDRVLVMEGGRIVEFAHPNSLFKNRDGHFSRMLQQTGKTMSEKLAAIAESAFLLSSEFGEESSDDTITVSDYQTTHL